MNPVPEVLGLPAELAEARLAQAGFMDVDIRVSGRRREGAPRVIRQKMNDGRIELVLSYFKELSL